MICKPCQTTKHEDCPAAAGYHEHWTPDPDSEAEGSMVKVVRPPTGLSEKVKHLSVLVCVHVSTE